MEYLWIINSKTDYHAVNTEIHFLSKYVFRKQCYHHQYKRQTVHVLDFLY